MSEKLVEELMKPLGGFRNEQERENAEKFTDYVGILSTLTLADAPHGLRRIKLTPRPKKSSE